MLENKNDCHGVYKKETESKVSLRGIPKKVEHIIREFKKKGVDRLILITGNKSYKKTYEKALETLQKNKLPFIHYDATLPNSTIDQVDMATRLAIQFDAKAVLALGEESLIDMAKGVGVLSAPEYQGKTAEELYKFKFTPSTALPVVTVDLTDSKRTKPDLVTFILFFLSILLIRRFLS